MLAKPSVVLIRRGATSRKCLSKVSALGPGPAAKDSASFLKMMRLSWEHTDISASDSNVDLVLNEAGNLENRAEIKVLNKTESRHFRGLLQHSLVSVCLYPVLTCHPSSRSRISHEWSCIAIPRIEWRRMLHGDHHFAVFEADGASLIVFSA